MTNDPGDNRPAVLAFDFLEGLLSFPRVKRILPLVHDPFAAVIEIVD